MKGSDVPRHVSKYTNLMFSLLINGHRFLCNFFILKIYLIIKTINLNKYFENPMQNNNKIKGKQ